MQCLTSARGANPTAPNAKVVFSWKMFCNFWSVGLGRAAAGAHKTARKVCCCDDFVVVVVSASVFWSGIPAGVIGLEPCRSRAAGAGGGSTDGQASTQDRGAWNTAKKKIISSTFLVQLVLPHLDLRKSANHLHAAKAAPRGLARYPFQSSTVGGLPSRHEVPSSASGCLHAVDALLAPHTRHHCPLFPCGRHSRVPAPFRRSASPSPASSPSAGVAAARAPS